MGSAYFYLEFLVAWVTRLKERGFKNPAIFALEYTLVPDAVWPQQFIETAAGYQLLMEYMGGSSLICVSGDSAGATLILSRLLHHRDHDEIPLIYEVRKPALAILISPWTHLISPLNRNTPSDYLDAQALELYGRQYLGNESAYDDIISPGLTEERWELAMPSQGYCIIYGSEEVFAPAIQETIQNMEDDGAWVTAKKEVGGIHAWPVVNLFLGSTKEERLKGLNQMTDVVVERMGSLHFTDTLKRTRSDDATSNPYPFPKRPHRRNGVPSRILVAHSRYID
jgi:acetyl esterase/lipase